MRYCGFIFGVGRSFLGGRRLLALDTPTSLSARPVGQEEAQPFAPSLVDPDVIMTKENFEAQLNELQDSVSRLGLTARLRVHCRAHRPFLSPR